LSKSGSGEEFGFIPNQYSSIIVPIAPLFLIFISSFILEAVNTLSIVLPTNLFA